MSVEPPVRMLAHRSAARTIRAELTRRGFLATALAAGGAVLLSACAPGQSATAVHAQGGPLEDRLSIYSWGDYDAAEVLQRFTAENGPRIVLDAFSSNEELVAKLVASRGTSGYDIVVPSGVFVGPMAENGLLQRLNLDLLSNLRHVAPEFRGRSWDPGNEFSICKAWGTTGFDLRPRRPGDAAGHLLLGERHRLDHHRPPQPRRRRAVPRRRTRPAHLRVRLLPRRLCDSPGRSCAPAVVQRRRPAGYRRVP